jgi:hypothetical protein
MTEYSSMEDAFNAKRRQYEMQNRVSEMEATDHVINLNIPEEIREPEYSDLDSSDSVDDTYDNRGSNNSDGLVFNVVPEDKGDGLYHESRQDPYEKYNPEPNADALLEATGATITYSSVTVGGETYVKRPIRGIF